jgi:hypothetical protein
MTLLRSSLRGRLADGGNPSGGSTVDCRSRKEGVEKVGLALRAGLSF